MKIKDYFIKRKFKNQFGVVKPSLTSYSDYDYVAMRPMDDIKNNLYEDFWIQNRQSSISNQGKYGACVAYGSLRVLSQIVWSKFRSAVEYSEPFVYLNRSNTDTTKLFSLEGLIPKEALHHLKNDGVVVKSQFPTMKKWNDLTSAEKQNPIPHSLFALAAKNKIDSYVALKTNAEKLHFLHKFNVGFNIVIPVTKKFVGGKNKMITMDWAKANLQGYHYLTVEGIKTIGFKQYWIVANSWGKEWGDHGYCYLPLNYPIIEAWGMIDESNDPPYWRVQIGAYANEGGNDSKSGAKVVQDFLDKHGYPTYLVKIWSEEHQKDLFKVQIGAYSDKNNADNMLKKIQNDPTIKLFSLGAFEVKY